MGQEAAGWFERAMALNAESSAAGHVEGAYHALMAALHFARDMEDEAGLLRVAKAAEEQGRSVDSLRPDHRLSSPTAKSHGHESVFQLAKHQAEAGAKMARLARQKANPSE